MPLKGVKVASQGVFGTAWSGVTEKSTKIYPLNLALWFFVKIPSTTPRLKYELSSGHIQKHEFAQYCKRGDSSGIIWQCIEQLLHVRLL